MRGTQRCAVMLGLVLAACNDSSVTVGNANPTGIVGGLVLDAATQLPLGGVQVSVQSAAGTLPVATSAEDGSWQVKKVPAGSFILSFALDGYVGATFNQTLEGAVGNFPVSNPTATVGPIGLVKNSGRFDVRIVDENGAAVAGVSVVARPQVRYVDYASGGPAARGAYQVSASSGADGLVALAGLPDYAGLGGVVSDSLPIDVPPIKVAATTSESYAFLGGTFTFQVGHLGATQAAPTIVLAGPSTSLQVLESNVDYLVRPTVGATGALVPASGPITVAFNQAVNPSTVRAAFFGEDGKPAAAQAAATVQTNLLSIAPTQPLAAGARYDLQLHVDALKPATAASEYNVTAPFFVQPQEGDNPAVLSNTPHYDNQVLGPDTATTVVFDLTEPIGQGSGASGAIPCVAFYENANFDNDGGVLYCGEYPSGAAASALSCSACPAAIDVTTLYPLEQAKPTTGFSSRWAVRIDAPTTTGPCSPAATSCQRPTSQQKIHLVFSKLPPDKTVRRVNGQPVDDKIVLVIP